MPRVGVEIGTLIDLVPADHKLNHCTGDISDTSGLEYSSQPVKVMVRFWIPFLHTRLPMDFHILDSIFTLEIDYGSLNASVSIFGAKVRKFVEI